MSGTAVAAFSFLSNMFYFPLTFFSLASLSMWALCQLLYSPFSSSVSSATHPMFPRVRPRSTSRLNVCFCELLFCFPHTSALYIYKRIRWFQERKMHKHVVAEVYRLHLHFQKTLAGIKCMLTEGGDWLRLSCCVSADSHTHTHTHIKVRHIRHCVCSVCS